MIVLLCSTITWSILCVFVLLRRDECDLSCKMLWMRTFLLQYNPGHTWCANHFVATSLICQGKSVRVSYTLSLKLNIFEGFFVFLSSSSSFFFNSHVTLPASSPAHHANFCSRCARFVVERIGHCGCPNEWGSCFVKIPTVSILSILCACPDNWVFIVLIRISVLSQEQIDTRDRVILDRQCRRNAKLQTTVVEAVGSLRALRIPFSKVWANSSILKLDSHGGVISEKWRHQHNMQLTYFKNQASCLSLLRTKKKHNSIFLFNLLFSVRFSENVLLTWSKSWQK